MTKFYCIICGIFSLLALSAIASILASILAAGQAQAQLDELISVTSEGVSKADTEPQAVTDITNAVTANTARAQLIDLIGDARYQKFKSAAENKIIRQSAKFIPFVNPGQPVRQPDKTWKMTVTMKISSESLRKMVLEAGLLSESEGPASILPMIGFIDRTKGTSEHWWMGEEKDDAHRFLNSLAREFDDHLQAEFSRQGFHFVKPVAAVRSPLPEAFRVEHPVKKDLEFISEFFKTPMIARGDVRFRIPKESSGAVLISVKMQIFQALSGRSVAEISRQIMTENGSFEAVIRNKMSSEMPEISKDLAAQVYDAWQRGTLNANLVKLSVRGSLDPKQLALVKAGILRNVHEIKDLKERLFEPGKVLFEVETSGDAKSLADRLKGSEIPSFDTKVADASATEVTFDVHPH